MKEDEYAHVSETVDDLLTSQRREEKRMTGLYLQIDHRPDHTSGLGYRVRKKSKEAAHPLFGTGTLDFPGYPSSIDHDLSGCSAYQALI